MKWKALVDTWSIRHTSLGIATTDRTIALPARTTEKPISVGSVDIRSSGSRTCCMTDGLDTLTVWVVLTRLGVMVWNFDWKTLVKQGSLHRARFRRFVGIVLSCSLTSGLLQHSMNSRIRNGALWTILTQIRTT